MRERIVSIPWWLVAALSLESTLACSSIYDADAELVAPSRQAQKKTETSEAPRSGASACEPHTCELVTPGDALITDFEDVREDGVFYDANHTKARDPDWWLKFYGSSYVYPRGGDALSQVFEGSWHVSGQVADWSGFGLWLGACTVDMSRYRGVSFDVGGDVGASGQLKLFVNTAPNQPPETCRPNVGSCDPEAGECRHPMTMISVAREVKKVSVLFSDVQGGAPVATPDPAQILQFHFAFDWFDFQGQKHEPYPVALTLDNFELIQ